MIDLIQDYLGLIVCGAAFFIIMAIFNKKAPKEL